MRHKRIKLIAVLLLGLGFTVLQAQTMYVKQSAGTQTAYVLISKRKITFSGGNATIYKTDNSTGVYALSGLRYFNFTDLTTSIEKPLHVKEQLLNVYPNPVSNELHIDLIGTPKCEGTINILDMEGKTVLSQKINQAGLLVINLSYLPNGIYVCRYSNANELKTVKIIKQ
jgi:hypothetical protein